MQLFSCLLFGVSASLDSLLVGVSFGLRRVRILLWQNLFISFVTFLGTCLSALLGACLLPLLPPLLGRCAGSLILMLLGVYYIMKWSLRLLPSRRRRRDDLTETSVPKGLTLPEIAFLSVTLSANNIGIGLSASMAGISLLPAAVSTMLCSILFLFTGNRLGRSRFLRAVGSAADPISGLLLIGLGILQLA
ncbi:MAG: manganese efflux pump [bacterium]|nr:manganese efflux pump [bacterium]